MPHSIWQAPLVPAALVITAGIVMDRYASPPLPVSLVVAIVALLAWFFVRAGSHRGLPLLYLSLAAAALAAAYHHYRRDVYAVDDISYFVKEEPAPMQLRGFLDEEPLHQRAPADDPLRLLPRSGSTTTVLRVSAVRRGASWIRASGRVRVLGVENWPELHCGDGVEIVGQLMRIDPPGNPGEFDFAASMRDRGIRIEMLAKKTPQAVTLLERGWTTSFSGWLAVLRGRGQQFLRATLPSSSENLATALLLGEGSSMTRADWDKYIRTGVIHVLAISGQHLVILAGFLWFMLPRLGVRQRRAAWIVALLLLGYALLTGGRPPALRSAVAVCAACGGLILRRRVLPANLFALSWLAVAVVNPTDLFTSGCLLSFLSVAILYWGMRQRFEGEPDPLQQLIEQSRPAWQRVLRRLAGMILASYAITLLIWLAITPLSASRYQMISPSGLLLGPPLVALTTVALFAGFLLLFACALSLPLTGLLAAIVHGSLSACEYLVDGVDHLPYSHSYTGTIPPWWLWIFYLGLLAALTQQWLRNRWRWAGVAGMGWLCVGLAAGAARVPNEDLRCTFLAVGHGGCTVLETADGRTLLYDAGSLAGPDVTRRHIVPFLLHRGIQRIDELILSHAHLEHINGVPDLLERFAVGQVTCTPSFTEQHGRGNAYILNMLRQRGIPLRIVKAGDRLTAGDVVLEVLHPPPVGPDGNENARSLLLRVRHAGHSILLTGDLADAGLQRVLRELPPARMDVMMAPHHGSHRTNTQELADWARPRVVISCQGRPPLAAEVRKRYARVGAQVFDTHQQGAVTVHSRQGAIMVETFRTSERLIIRASDAN